MAIERWVRKVGKSLPKGRATFLTLTSEPLRQVRKYFLTLLTFLPRAVSEKPESSALSLKARSGQRPSWPSRRTLDAVSSARCLRLNDLAGLLRALFWGVPFSSCTGKAPTSHIGALKISPAGARLVPSREGQFHDA